jgi:hypothetical protein
MNNSKLYPSIFLLIAVFFLAYTVVYAQDRSGTGDTSDTGNTSDTGTGDIRLDDPLEGQDFIDVVNKIATGLLQIAAPLVVIMVIIGGFQVMSSGGNEEKYVAGRKTILYAVIGFAIVLVAKSIALIIKNLLTG